ncbi:MAG: ABC transporter ATP-binding protein [Deltaproteobacteria bacterium]|nr:ABC transporter ATP-binding protein [Deltaproteobacteria bacterium]
MAVNDRLLLQIEKMEVVYHHVITAIQGISLNIGDNQIVALLGTNGAGKTTILRAISGFLGLDNAKVTEGSICFQGEEIQNKPPHIITQKGIVLVPERNKVFEHLTVEENLHLSAGLTGEQDQKILDYFPVLRRIKRRLGGYLSGGERQMLALAAALLCRPKLLLIDEMSLGLAPLVVRDLMQLVKTIREENRVSILLVEQNATAALEIADYGYVIENGRLVYAGDIEKLKNHKDIQEFYLGRGEQQSRKSYREVKQYRRTRRWYG